MEILQILILIVLAGLCGAVAEIILGYSEGGLLVAVIIGIIGAYFGMAVALRLGWLSIFTFGVGNQPLDPIWAILGSMVVVALLMLIKSSLDGFLARRA